MGVDFPSAVLFASLLCDNGLDLDLQPSKLWASHEEFQEVTSTNIGDVGVPNISDLVDVIGQISTENRFIAFPVFCTGTKPSGLQPGIAKPSKGENSRLIKFSTLLKLRFRLFSSIPLNRRQLEDAVRYDSCEWLPDVKELTLISLNPIILIILSISVMRLPKSR